MKLASLKDGTRDGKLLVVSRDLTRAVIAVSAAPTLQQALESWPACEGRLRTLSEDINAGHAAGSFALDPTQLGSPLPRAWQWLDVRVGGGARPLMYQGAGDEFLGPVDDVPLPSEQDGIDCEGEIGIIVDRVPMGTDAAAAAGHIRLLVLINGWSLRVLAEREAGTGVGFLQSKPATGFAPVAVTPDEVGPAWHAGRVQLPILLHRNGVEFGRLKASDTTFGFGELIAHAARTRHLGAGTIIGSGTVSTGASSTGYLKFGDRVRIEMRTDDGQSVFGAIDQRVVAARAP